MSLSRRITRKLGAHFGGAIIRVRTDQPVAALTFDDGPDPRHTPQLLDTLAAGGAKGTFFIVGEAACRHPELVARIHTEGHAIGNHSWSHPSFPLLPANSRRLQIERCAQLLPPQETKLFRPPYGHQSWRSRFQARRMGYQIIGWDSHCEDWRIHTPEELHGALSSRIKPGSIVLLHDTLYKTTDSSRRDRAPLLAALQMLFEETRDSMTFVTVPELLRRGRPVSKKWIWRPDPALADQYSEDPAPATD